MLISCPECGHEVSDKAETCPHCGIIIAGKKKSGSSRFFWVFLVILLILLAGGGLGGYFFYQHTQKQSEQSAFERAIESREPAMLQNFLDIYTDASSAHRDSVKSRLEELKRIDQEWANVMHSRSKTALLKYIQLHPESVHVTEAKLLVDSLDWIQASNLNTLESYQAYIDAHQDGLHYDDAKMNLENLKTMVVSPEELQMISQLFTTYFNSLAKKDEISLATTLGTVIHNFFNRQNVSKEVVINYMEKLHEAADIIGMSFSLGNDWKIEKVENAETGAVEYAVSFTVEQRTERTDDSKEKQATYKVNSKVSSEGLIVDLNMRKLVSH